MYNRIHTVEYNEIENTLKALSHMPFPSLLKTCPHQTMLQQLCTIEFTKSCQLRKLAQLLGFVLHLNEPLLAKLPYSHCNVPM